MPVTWSSYNRQKAFTKEETLGVDKRFGDFTLGRTVVGQHGQEEFERIRTHLTALGMRDYSWLPSLLGETIAQERWFDLGNVGVKEAAPGSTPARPLHVSAVPGEIDWDAIPEDFAERFLALNAELVALQPASGGLVIGENGASVG